MHFEDSVVVDCVVPHQAVPLRFVPNRGVLMMTHQLVMPLDNRCLCIQQMNHCGTSLLRKALLLPRSCKVPLPHRRCRSPRLLRGHKKSTAVARFF